ncbi:MAG: DNA repair protein RadC [Candidatus Omnitrophota bacterium]
MNNITIHDLPRVERPREKLIRYGPDRLTNAELLAVILRTGSRRENVLALAARILRVITFARLPHATRDDLARLSGIGPAKACGLLASVELGKRMFESKKAGIGQLLSPRDVFDGLRDIRESKKEHFVVFFLDTRNQQIKREIISVGTINASLVHPREVFEPAVKHLAVQVILAHNHPSGDLEPSEEDLDVNRRLTEAGKILGIEVLDHVIVTRTAFKSFRDGGL